MYNRHVGSQLNVELITTRYISDLNCHDLKTAYTALALSPDLIFVHTMQRMDGRAKMKAWYPLQGF